MATHPYGRKIPHNERFQAVRRAVHTITLRDGVGAISLPAVSAEVDLSVSSLRRLLPSSALLPRLGLEWVFYGERCRWSSPVEGGFTRAEMDGDTTGALWACNNLLRAIPATPERRDDIQVRRLLTAGFPRENWALDDVRSGQLHLAATIDRVLPSDLAAEIRAIEATRLTALVLGSIEAVCQEAIRPEESVVMVRHHLDDLLAAWLATRGTGAA